MAGRTSRAGVVAKGLPIIIVNPSAPVGPRDAKPTRPASSSWISEPETSRVSRHGIELGPCPRRVHRTCSRCGKRTCGERYILGNTEGNWTMQQMLKVLEEITGLPAPKLKVPYWAALTAAHVDETISSFTGKPPKAPLAGRAHGEIQNVVQSGKKRFVNWFAQTPPKQALANAVECFVRMVMSKINF